MKMDQLRSALRRQPFRPFTIITASGEKYAVTHPERVMISDSGRTLGIFLAGEDTDIIDMEAITEFVARPSRKRKVPEE